MRDRVNVNTIRERVEADEYPKRAVEKLQRAAESNAYSLEKRKRAVDALAQLPKSKANIVVAEVGAMTGGSKDDSEIADYAFEWLKNLAAEESGD